MPSSRASLPKPLDPLLEALDRVAKAGDRAGELVHLAARHEEALLIDGVVRRRLGEPPPRIGMPPGEAPPRPGEPPQRIGMPPGEASGRPGDAVRSHVA